MESYSCDRCGEEISKHRDMINGKFTKIVNYHPACCHISSIEIIFSKDHSLVTPAPDLCENCVIVLLTDVLKKGKK